MSTKHKSNPPCDCGCGGTTRGGRYLPGHDAKHKKTLVEAALGGSKRAANRLEKLGWSKFLEAKRERVAKETGKDSAGAAAGRRSRRTTSASERVA